MKRILLYAVVATFLLTTFLCWKIAIAGESLQGKEIYANNCQMCHGANGTGDGPAASSFNPPPRDFTDSAFWKSNPETKIKNAVENGFGNMPSVGLEPDQTKAVINYMENAFKK